MDYTSFPPVALRPSLQTILEADSIYAGTQLPKAIFIGMRVVTFCRMKVIRLEIRSRIIISDPGITSVI
jgi:hypothetical protein